jgi:DNA helicase-2/ATP-dependent DNA helicase PcrA
MEIKHALAYLRLIASSEDDSAFLRVVNFPVRGIGARSLEALQDAAKAGNTSLYNAVPQLGGKAANSLGAFVAMIAALRKEAEGLALPEIVEHMLARSGLLAHFQAEKDGADRLENLHELVNAAALFVQEQEDGHGLAEFLTHAALEAGEHQAGEGSDALQLMTVHSAKGLEFQAVFVTGLEEGLFPHEQSRNENDGLEEERRLMYVAITRARSRLYLSFAQNRMLHGQTRYNVASRFLDEIPAGLVKWLTPRMGGQPLTEPVLASARDAAIPRSLPRATQMGWRIGQNVVHAKFGQGVIVDAEGQGPDARLQINFGRQGMKWLALEYAKLSAA